MWKQNKRRVENKTEDERDPVTDSEGMEAMFQTRAFFFLRLSKTKIQNNK